MAKNKQLIKFRVSMGKSQEEMAHLLSISTSFYRKVEHGIRNPSYNFIERFKEQFPNANIEEIFFNK